MKLISITDFVLEQTNKITNEWSEDDQIRLLDKISNYANFLKQPLKLEMFVPCDENENPLDEFIHNIDSKTMSNEYQQAKEKVLFEGFDLSTAKFHCGRKDRTIEYFTLFEIELTSNAIKQLGL